VELLRISDFPTWFGLGSYGGLGCTLLTAAGITMYALLRRRGSSGQLARSVLACLLCSVFTLCPIWWDQNRLELYGPSLPDGEVLFWLLWTALLGWLIPLGVLFSYLVLAENQVFAEPKMYLFPPTALAALDDPARNREPLGAGIAWGQLIPLAVNPDLADGAAEVHPIALTRQLTVLGREKDCDVVIDDPSTSRHHAEIYWDHGRVQLVDRSSTNGTLVNRQTARGPVLLIDGDILDLGTQRYRFVLTHAEAHQLQNREERERWEAEIETTKVASISSISSIAPSPDPAPLLLAGLSPELAGASWVVDKAVTTVGRDPTLDICIPHESVSRRHAQIVRQQSGYFLSDLDSSNGTYQNGERLSAPSLLAHGDILRIGSIELQCDYEPLPPSQQTTIPLDGTTATIVETV
jgi:pSer/pThr/pTyr-binding forkhead associated (FHA) protein